MWWRIQSMSGAAISALTHLPGGQSAWGLLFWFSALVTLVALAIVRVTVAPERVRRARNRALACLMEFRLYQHELTSVARIMGRTVGATLRYLAVWMPPLFVLVLALWPLFAQAYLRFEYRPFRVGETVHIKVAARNAADVAELSLQFPEGDALEPDGEPFRSMAAGEAVWRARVRRPGRISARAAVAGWSVDFFVMAAGDGTAAVSPVRVAADRIGRFSVLGEAPWAADSPVAEIFVDYPRRMWRVGNTRIHWALACFMLCMAFGMALKPAFGVEF
jgi:hypothetical protein